jgi:hypothetical protein
VKFSVRQRTTREPLKERTSSRDLSIMNYKIVMVVLKSTRKRGGSDGEEERGAYVEPWNDLVGVRKRLILRFCLSSSSLSPTRMSRGGGRGGRGWRGGGRGGFGGASNLPPMGLSFADIQNLSREASALYPVC